MTTGIEFLDLLAAVLTLAFIVKLVFIGDDENIPNASGNREKLSLLNQQIAPRYTV